MKTSAWLAVAAVVLLLTRADAGGEKKVVVVKKGRAAAAAAAPPAQQLVTPVEYVQGEGPTRELAQDQAALRAQAKVEELLRARFGEGGWKRRPHQLEPDYLQEMGVLVPDDAAPPGAKAVVARYKLALTRRYLDAISKEVAKGFGRTRHAALEQAALHAQEDVERLLNERFGQDGWRVPARLLEPELLKELGVIVPDAEPRLSREHNDGKTMAAYYRVDLTPEYLRAIQLAVRTESMQDRHGVLLRVLAGLVAVLLVTTGYLRLEEMTRGYATALLRAAAAAVLLLTGLGLMLTF